MERKVTHRYPFIFVVVFILLMVIAAVITWLNKEPGHAAPANPCGFNSPACIRVTGQDGIAYGLNDFRFTPNKCIDFISLPDHTAHRLCGDYQLEWIGPGQTT